MPYKGCQKSPYSNSARPPIVTRYNFRSVHSQHSHFTTDKSFETFRPAITCVIPVDYLSRIRFPFFPDTPLHSNSLFSHPPCGLRALFAVPALWCTIRCFRWPTVLIEANCLVNSRPRASSVPKTTIRAIQFSSSRMFPGHLHCCKITSADSLSFSVGLP